MPLTATQIAQFKQDGYLVLRGLAPPDLRERMRAVTLEHLQRAVPPLEFEAELGYPGAPPSLDAPGGQTVRRLQGAFARDEAFRAWALNPELISDLRQLLGEPVSLALAHHNCIMTKHPDYGTATGWHRDIRYWAFERQDLISVWLALDRETDANGVLHLIPGSHRMAIARDQLDELDFLRPDVPANRALFEQGIALELQPGDVLLFHSGVFHSAGRNGSQRMKASVVFAYHAQSNRPVPGSRSAAGGSMPIAE